MLDFECPKCKGKEIGWVAKTTPTTYEVHCRDCGELYIIERPDNPDMGEDRECQHGCS
jgi:hypothetical protein